MTQQIDKTLITGANGFVGRHLMAELTSKSAPIVAVSREQVSISGVATLGIGTFDKQTNWAQHLEGVCNVVHLAGRAHVLKETESDPRTAFMRSNVDATVTLAKAAKTAGAQSFIFLSSIAIYAPDQKHLNQGSTPNPQSDYGHSKWTAEQELMSLQDENFRVLILRPPLVFGPNVSANFARLLSLAWAGLPLPLGGVKNQRTMLYVGNLVGAITASLQRHEALSGAYLVADAQQISTPMLLKTLADSMKRPNRNWSLPESMIYPIVKMLGRGTEWNKLNGTLTVDGSHLTNQLTSALANGSKLPTIGLNEALKITGEWYASTKR